MAQVLRLGSRPEIWSSEIREALSAAPRVFLLEHEAPLVAALEGAGIEPLALKGPLSDDDIVVVPAAPLEELLQVVDRLLGPGGCPWDQEQTHESLKRHLLEETYEVLDAIDSGSPEALREELGDLLLQPLMHGQISAAAGGFDTNDVASALVDKLVRRHPHVFGSVSAADSAEVLRNWDAIKKQEKASEAEASILGGVPKGMASLLRAFEISKRAARAGFEWPDVESVFDKLHEEEAELLQAMRHGSLEEIRSEVGDLLFTAVNIARWLQIEPEEALQKMLNRFTERFMEMERRAGRPLSDLSPQEWDDLWRASKLATGARKT
jgi:tetrapyrrole methylase family protein / MazG family protein